MTCVDGLPCFSKDSTMLGHLPSMHVDADELGLGICPTIPSHGLSVVCLTTVIVGKCLFISSFMLDVNICSCSSHDGRW